jgi:hypothetical protein
MKKIVRLTESDLVNIVKRVIEEQTTPAVIDAGYSRDMQDYAIVLSQPTIAGGSGYKGTVTAQVKFNGVRIKDNGSPVTKGNMMVSAGNGYAQACATPAVGTVIGKSLENFSGTTGVIEVVVGRM